MVLNTMKTKKKNQNLTKQEKKQEKERSKESKKIQKEAETYLDDVVFVNCKEVRFNDQTSRYVLEKKNGEITIVFTLSGMTIEGITENEFKNYYVKPLKTFFNYNENFYCRFMEVPIDFSNNIIETEKNLRYEQNEIRKRIFENDLDFFEIMQEERLLQTYPVIFVDVKENDRINDVIMMVENNLQSFHSQFFNKEQLEIIVKYFGNPGTMLPAFVAL